MQTSDLEEEALFRAIEDSGTRAILFGRRALIALGLPVVTFDYDFWIHSDDLLRFNAALEPIGLVANRDPAQARKFGRYVLENDLRVDVLVARACPTVDGVRLNFDDLWERRQTLEIAPGVHIAVPSIDDLIATKRFAQRPKDAEDIRLLTALRDWVEP